MTAPDGPAPDGPAPGVPPDISALDCYSAAAALLAPDLIREVEEHLGAAT